MTAPKLVLYHNPGCSKLREVLQMLLDAGQAPEVVDYLEARWTKDLLLDLMKAGRIEARGLLRANEPLAAELGLLGAATDEAVLSAMVAHPVLVERPILRSAKGAVVARPKERIFDIL